MKSVFLLEDGRMQLVVTPETDTERRMLSCFSNYELKADIYKGGYYACQGGWTRESNDSHDSLIVSLVIDK